VLVAVLGLVYYLDSSLQRTTALGSAGSADTKGTNWLLLGSDSRQGLSQDQRDKLSTGNADDAGGARTDTMMLVHVPEGGGQPAMISLPRDSLVEIAGSGGKKGKLNAAFNDGPQQLVQTIEGATGLHIDRYAEVGLGGFAELVEAVGGVDLCVDQPLKDPKAGLDLAAGCQRLNGAQALGFVRTREFANGDLERVQNQRKLLSALIDKTMQPSTMFNPFRLVPLASGATRTFVVNDGDHIWHLGSLAMAMGDISGGKGVTTTVPFGGFGEDDDGQSVVVWDRKKAPKMFEALANDTPIPPDVLEK
jgi:LCP family protein required for cell wall assembly